MKNINDYEIKEYLLELISESKDDEKTTDKILNIISNFGCYCIMHSNGKHDGDPLDVYLHDFINEYLNEN